MVSILVGLTFICAGLWGLVHWFPNFLYVMQGFIPISLFLGGLVTLVTGFASLRSSRQDENKEKKS